MSTRSCTSQTLGNSPFIHSFCSDCVLSKRQVRIESAHKDLYCHLPLPPCLFTQHVQHPHSPLFFSRYSYFRSRSSSTLHIDFANKFSFVHSIPFLIFLSSPPPP